MTGYGFTGDGLRWCVFMQKIALIDGYVSFFRIHAFKGRDYVLREISVNCFHANKKSKWSFPYMEQKFTKFSESDESLKHV